MSIAKQWRMRCNCSEYAVICGVSKKHAMPYHWRGQARKSQLDPAYLKNISVLRANWQIIKEEALALQATGAFEAIKTPGSVGYYDVGFRTFYKRGWSKFYLMWYGTTLNSGLRLCPQTVALLKQLCFLFCHLAQNSACTQTLWPAHYATILAFAHQTPKTAPSVWMVNVAAGRTAKILSLMKPTLTMRKTILKHRG